MVGGLDESAIEVVKYPKGKLLFKQGESGDAAYIVNSGAVGIYREAQGRKIPLGTVRRGELFGEMAVIDKSPRLATAFTVEDSTLMVISIDLMMSKMQKADPFIRALIHMLMNNLRSVHDSFTPRSRSLVDAVNSLHRQSDVVGRFLQGDAPDSIREKLGAKLKDLDGAIKDLRRVAMAHRSEDRRDDAVPSETDLPTPE
ncbi:MAG: cyclic nucleotide-binding domain-containing protein [Rhodospirillaceae bacterium]